MKSILSRLACIAATNRGGLALFSVLFLATALAAAIPQPAPSGPPAPAPAAPAAPSAPVVAQSGGLRFSANLSQTKVVRGGNGEIYLEVSIEPPAGEVKEGTRQAATDLLVVLDRSGSMSEDNKLPFAKAAIRDLLARLKSDDRFALVCFDSEAQVYQPLTPVIGDARSRIEQMVEAIRPGSATNIGDGLVRAKEILKSSSGGRVRKLVLLSDGQANTGVTDEQELGRISSGLVSDEAIVSTIGMGLDFNERLLVRLADQGMGGYTYLESLANLSELLNKNLLEARNTFSRSTTLALDLPQGVRLVDAGGYPWDTTDRAKIQVPIGQLLGGVKKRVILTLAVSTAELRSAVFNGIKLHYAEADLEKTLELAGEPLTVAVVEESRTEEAVASINAPVYRQSWVNNFGRMQRKLNAFVASGDRAKAKELLGSYSDQLFEAEKSSGVSLGSLKSDLSSTEARVDDAFTGSTAQQAVKQNKTAKSVMYDSLKYQRE